PSPEPDPHVGGAGGRRPGWGVAVVRGSVVHASRLAPDDGCGPPGAVRLRAMASWLRRTRTDLLLVGYVLVLAGSVVQVLMAHQASRLAFTAALWDTGGVVIDDYEPIIGVDFAEPD